MCFVDPIVVHISNSREDRFPIDVNLIGSRRFLEWLVSMVSHFLWYEFLFGECLKKVKPITFKSLHHLLDNENLFSDFVEFPDLNQFGEVVFSFLDILEYILKLMIFRIIDEMCGSWIDAE